MRCIGAVVVAVALCGCGFKPSTEGGSSGSSSSGATSTSSSSTSSGGTTSTNSSSTSSGGTTSTSSSSTSSGTTSSTTTSTSSSSSSGGTSGTQNSGDCSSNSDCLNSVCVEVTPGGFRQCVVPPKAPETCTTNGYDQCCPDGSLTCPNNEACILGPAVPYCGGVMQQAGNVCAADQCARDSDCGSANVLCAPAGTLGVQVRACVYAACLHDTDCTAQTGGKCEPVADPCCGTVYGLYCVYPGGCRSNADCANGYCQQGVCQSGSPACPL